MQAIPKSYTLNKVVRIGWHPETGNTFAKIEYNEGRLSICGVEGPKSNGDAKGSCGQILDHIEVRDYAPGWNAELLAKFVEVWDRWHLNDMRAGCEHQRAAKWDEKPIDPSKPTNAYGKHFEGQRSSSWNMLAWVSRDEHPEGLLSFPCEVCGYKYGTKWLKEDVPADVIEFLRDLPDTDKTPAWV